MEGAGVHLPYYCLVDEGYNHCWHFYKTHSQLTRILKWKRRRRRCEGEREAGPGGKEKETQTDRPTGWQRLSVRDREKERGREKRRQNIEKMNEEMERIAEYERGQRVRVSVFMEYFYQVSSDAHVCWSVNHSSHIIDWTPQVSFPFICQFVIISVPVLVLLPIYDLFFFSKYKLSVSWLVIWGETTRTSKCALG